MTRSGFHLPEKGPLFDQNKFILLRKIEICLPLGVRLDPRAISFIRGEAFEGNQSIGDVVRALVRHPIAEEVAAAFRDDGEPTPRVLLEGIALESDRSP